MLFFIIILFYVLTFKNLFFTGDEIGCIDLRTVSELKYPTNDSSIVTNNPYSFDMVAGERVWTLGASDSDDLETWMGAICTSTKRLGK